MDAGERSRRVRAVDCTGTLRSFCSSVTECRRGFSGTLQLVGSGLESHCSVGGEGTDSPALAWPVRLFAQVLAVATLTRLDDVSDNRLRIYAGLLIVISVVVVFPLYLRPV
jgi:hypothetical protein